MSALDRIERLDCLDPQERLDILDRRLQHLYGVRADVARELARVNDRIAVSQAQYERHRHMTVVIQL